MEFSRQKHWSGLPFPPPGDLPNPGIEPRSPVLQQILYCLSLLSNREKKVKQAHVFVPHQFQVCSIRQLNAQNSIKCQIQSCVCVCVCSVISNSWDPMDCSLPGFCPWNSPDKNTGVGCRFLLQGSSQPKDRTHVSYVCCIVRQILYHWAMWEATALDCH